MATRSLAWGIDPYIDPVNPKWKAFRALSTPTARTVPRATHAASVRQPHAQALIERRKRVEWRTWWPSQGGWLWLHASSAHRPSAKELEQYGYDPETFGGAGGAVLGLIRVDRIVACKPVARAAWAAAADRQFSKSMIQSDDDAIVAGWRIGAVRRLARPVPWKMGKLGLWPLGKALLARCQAELSRSGR